MQDAQALGLGEDLFISPAGVDQQDSKRRKSKETSSPHQQPVGMS